MYLHLYPAFSILMKCTQVCIVLINGAEMYKNLTLYVLSFSNHHSMSKYLLNNI